MTIYETLPPHSTSHIFHHSFPVPPRKNHSDFFYFVEEIYSSLNEAPLSNDVFVEYINTLIGSGNNFVEDIKDIANAVLAKVSNTTITHTFLVLYTIEIHLRQAEDQLTYKPTEDDYNNIWKAIISSECEYDAYQDSEKRQIQLTTWYMHALFKIGLQVPDSRAQQFDEETSELHFMIKLSSQRCFLNIPLDISSWLDNFTYIPDWFIELSFIDNALSSLSGPICLNKQTTIPLKDVDNWDFDVVQQTADSLLEKESDYLKLLGFALSLFNYSFNPKTDRSFLLFTVLPKLALSQYIALQELARRVAENILETNIPGDSLTKDRFMLFPLAIQSKKTELLNGVFSELQKENLQINESNLLKVLVMLSDSDKVRTLNIIAKHVNGQTKQFSEFLQLAIAIQDNILKNPQITLSEQQQSFKWLITTISQNKKDYLTIKCLNSLLKHSLEHFPELNSSWISIIEYSFLPGKELADLTPNLLIEWFKSLPNHILTQINSETSLKLKQIQDYISLLDLKFPAPSDPSKNSELLEIWNQNKSLLTDYTWYNASYFFKLASLVCHLQKSGCKLNKSIKIEHLIKLLPFIVQFRDLIDLYFEDMTKLMNKINLTSSERLNIVCVFYRYVSQINCNKLFHFLSNCFNKQDYAPFEATDVQVESLLIFAVSMLDFVSVAVIEPEQNDWEEKIFDIIKLIINKNTNKSSNNKLILNCQNLKSNFYLNKKTVYNHSEINKQFTDRTLKENLDYVLWRSNQDEPDLAIPHNFILWLLRKGSIENELDQEECSTNQLLFVRNGNVKEKIDSDDLKTIRILVHYAMAYCLIDDPRKWNIAAQIMLNEQLAMIYGIDEMYCRLAINVLKNIPEGTSSDKIIMFRSFFLNSKVAAVIFNNHTLFTEYTSAQIAAIKRIIAFECPLVTTKYKPLEDLVKFPTESAHIKYSTNSIKDEAILSIARDYFTRSISDDFLKEIITVGMEGAFDKKTKAGLKEIKEELEGQAKVIATLKNLAQISSEVTDFFKIVDEILKKINEPQKKQTDLLSFLKNHQNKRRFFRWIIQNWMVLSRSEKDQNRLKIISPLIYDMVLTNTSVKDRENMLRTNNVGAILFHLIQIELERKIGAPGQYLPLLDIIKSYPKAFKDVPGCLYIDLMSNLGNFLFSIGLLAPDRIVNILEGYESQLSPEEFQSTLDNILSHFYRIGRDKKDLFVLPFHQLNAKIFEWMIKSDKVDPSFFEKSLAAYLSIDPGMRTDEFTWNTTVKNQLSPTFEKAKELNKIEPARLECYQFLASPLNDQYKDEKRRDYLKEAEEISKEFNNIFDQKIKQLSGTFNLLEQNPPPQQKAQKNNGHLPSVLIEYL